jgi:WD40 repeat protein
VGTGGKKVPTIRLWDLATEKELRDFDSREEVDFITFSLDGKALASIGRYRAPARLWDVATGKELRALLGSENGLWDEWHCQAQPSCCHRVAAEGRMI